MDKIKAIPVAKRGSNGKTYFYYNDVCNLSLICYDDFQSLGIKKNLTTEFTTL